MGIFDFVSEFFYLGRLLLDFDRLLFHDLLVFEQTLLQFVVFILQAGDFALDLCSLAFAAGDQLLSDV